MPKIDIDEYNAASEPSAFEQITPGAYVAKVQKILTEGKSLYGAWTSDEKQYVVVLFDIAEGKFAGEYSRDFYADKDWLHCDYLSWKNIGFLKKKLNAFTNSNPGFDALAAFQADKWEMFVGKLFGVVLDGEVSTNDYGNDRWKLKVGDVIDAQTVRDGKAREPKITDNRLKFEESKPLYENVPF